jgi:hypothetical protein
MQDAMPILMRSMQRPVKTNSCAGRQESRVTLRSGMQFGKRHMIDEFES